MPFDIQVDPARRAGLITVMGSVTGHDLVDACQATVTSPTWEPGFDEVWDLTPSHEIDISPDGLAEMVASAHEYADRIGDSRCVFVYTRDGLDGVLRLFALLTKDMERTYHTVRSRDEAEAWLGLPPGGLPDPSEGVFA